MRAAVLTDFGEPLGHREVDRPVPAPDGADVSVDALGVGETCRDAVESFGVSGQPVQIGQATREAAGGISLPTDRIVPLELELNGARGMPPTWYDERLGLVVRGRVDPGALVTRDVGHEDVTSF